MWKGKNGKIEKEKKNKTKMMIGKKGNFSSTYITYEFGRLFTAELGKAKSQVRKRWENT